MIKRVVELPDEYLLLLLLVMAVVGFAIPWLVACVHGHFSCHVHPKKKRHSLWLALPAALFAFVVILFVTGLCLWPVVGHLPGMPWGLTDEGVFNLCLLILILPVSILSGLIYRVVRWEGFECK